MCLNKIKAFQAAWVKLASESLNSQRKGGRPFGDAIYLHAPLRNQNHHTEGVPNSDPEPAFGGVKVGLNVEKTHGRGMSQRKDVGWYGTKELAKSRIQLARRD